MGRNSFYSLASGHSRRFDLSPSRRRRARLVVAGAGLLRLLLLGVPNAFAQAPAPTAAPPAPPAPAATGASTPAPTAAGSLSTNTASVSDLPAPVVSDPMLTPPSPAPQSVVGLKEALDALRARSADLRVALLEVDRAEAQSRSALAALLPQVNGVGSLSHQLITHDVGGTTVPSENTASLGFTATQSVFSLPLLRARATSKLNVEVQRLQLADLKRSVLEGVMTAVVTVATTERIADLNRAGLKSALERLEIAKEKEKLGSANRLDTRRAEQDVESARASVVTGDESLHEAREALALAVGTTGEMGLGPTATPEQLLTDATQVCTSLTKPEDRADIRADVAQAEIAKRAVDDVKAQFLPTVSLQSSLQNSAASGSPSIPTTWSVSAVMNVPIWDGGNRYGLLHQNEALSEESRATLAAQLRGLTTNASQAHRAIDVALASRAVAERAQKLATEIDSLVQITYRLGTATSLDLVTAATARRQADISLALADFAVTRARLVDRLTLASCKY